MRRSGRTLGGAVMAVAVGILLSANLALAQPPSSSPLSAASLVAMVQAARASESYADGILAAATAVGQPTGSVSTLVAQGNASLLEAEAQLQTGGDVPRGFGEVQDAMGNFTAAAATLSSSLETAGLASSNQATADFATISALNASAKAMSASADQTCGAEVASAVEQQFHENCSQVTSTLDDAMFALCTGTNEAELLVSPSQPLTLTCVAPPGSQAPSSESAAITEAKADLATASTELTTLSSFAYAARWQAYLAGPLGSEYASANATVKLQTGLNTSLAGDVSSFQTLFASQTSISAGINSSAYMVAQENSPANFATVDTDATATQGDLANLASELDSIASQLNSLPLPATAISALTSATTSAEGSIASYDSSVGAVAGSAAEYSLITIGGFPAYYGTFSSDSSTEDTQRVLCNTAITNLQSDLQADVGEFPLVTSLGTWQSTVASLANGFDTAEVSLYNALESANASGAFLADAAVTLNSDVQGASAAEVAASLTQSISSISTSEGDLLGTAALGSLTTASTALGSDALAASSFVNGSESLLQLSTIGFASGLSGFGTDAKALGAQGQQTLAALSSASAGVSMDLSTRTGDVASGVSAITQASTDFDSGEISQATSMIESASAAFAAASSPA